MILEAAAAPPIQPASESRTPTTTVDLWQTGIVIGFLAGLTLLVIGAICLSKCTFRAVEKRRTVDESLGLDDQSGCGAAQERREILRLILDYERF
jgi:hypothetical protein